MNHKMPVTANVAEQIEDGRLIAPSAAKNITPISRVLREFAPREGRALEIASGTGQHCVTFAKVCPNLTWVPTDVDAERLKSIAIYVSEAQLENLTLPVKLDATTEGWSQTTGKLNLIVVVNLLHLISTAETQTLLKEAAQALALNGVFLLYGPFMRGGELTSQGDLRFHESLMHSDPNIGYKDDFDVIEWASNAGLNTAEVLEMPANNLCLIFKRQE